MAQGVASNKQSKRVSKKQHVVAQAFTTIKDYVPSNQSLLLCILRTQHQQQGCFAIAPCILLASYSKLSCVLCSCSAIYYLLVKTFFSKSKGIIVMALCSKKQHTCSAYCFALALHKLSQPSICAQASDPSHQLLFADPHPCANYYFVRKIVVCTK